MDKLTKKERKELHKQEMEEQLAKEKRNTMLKKAVYWVGGTIILVLAIWGLIVLANSSSSTTPTTEAKAPAVTSKDISTGPTNAKVTLIEYADFQCPACAAYAPMVKQLRQDFNGKVRFIYRFFPLSIHRYSMLSAQTAYAAYLQGKFWEMDSLLYDNQATWAQSSDPGKIMKEYAQSLKLDITKFDVDQNADSTKKFINEEENLGTEAGVNSTPTFFVNGTQIQNPQGYDAFKQLIQDALNKK